jgi:hypothetical protein
MVLLILLKIVLILLAILGMIVPAAIATKPAIRAYSTRSWPRVSVQILNFQSRFMIRFTGDSVFQGITPRWYEELG